MGPKSESSTNKGKKTTNKGEKGINSEVEDNRVKVNWVRIIFLGFITSLIFVVINIVITIIIIYGFNFDPVLTLEDISQYVFFGEAGFLIFLGACIGNFGQSIAISNLKAKLFKSEPMSKDSFSAATFNAFTYYSAAALLLIYLMIMIQILKLIVHFS